MQKSIFLRHSLIAGLLACCSVAWAAPAYTVTDLGTLGGTNSYATDINANGQIVGYSYTSGDATERAFIYSAGTMINLGTLGGSSMSAAYGINVSGQVVGDAGIAIQYSAGTMTSLEIHGMPLGRAYDINASGQVVGIYSTSSDRMHSYLYSAGTMADLGTFGGTRTWAKGINDSGQVVGFADTTGDLTTRAFLYNAGTMTDLGTLGGPHSWANGINASGQIVGASYINSDGAIRAFLYGSGTMTDLGTLGGYSQAFGINASGQIVGYTGTPRIGEYHAFLYSAGTMTDLNDLIDPQYGWSLDLTAAGISINDAGQIATTGRNAAGAYHALLLTPTSRDIPEPASLALLGLGGSALLGSRRRR